MAFSGVLRLKSTVIHQELGPILIFGVGSVYCILLLLLLFYCRYNVKLGIKPQSIQIPPDSGENVHFKW